MIKVPTFNQIVIRALSSITSEQAQTIAEVVHASAQAWQLQTFDDYDGYLSILIEPAIAGDDQKAFFISGTAQCLSLFETQDDDLTPLGTFTDVSVLAAQLTGLIERR